MKRLEARAIARTERRLETLLEQIAGLTLDRLTAAVLADDALVALVQAPDTNLDAPATWPAELQRRSRLIFEEIVASTGARHLVDEHDRLAALLAKVVCGA